MNLVKPITSFLLLLVLTLGLQDAYSQVVFSDDFSEFTDAAWVTSGNINGSEWEAFRSGIDYGVRRNSSPVQLEITNDVGAGANANGYAFASTLTAAFSMPYNTTLSNGGVVTWTFNMRQIRVNPSGFDVGNYGVAFILAGETATTNTTGNGYAVVLGQSGATDPVKLVRYSAGITGNATITDIIISNTAGLTDFDNEYLSVKVTYNPCQGGQWEFFLRNDGLTAFADPLTGTLVSQGTATDNTYTGSVLGMMATYWNAATTAAQTAFFNNVTVSVTPPPSATIGANPSVCAGITTANLTYTAASGTPDKYSINWDMAAEAQGFVDVTLSNLPVSPIMLTVPGAAPAAMYSGSLTLTNSTTGCTSAAYPISVTINALPVVTCPGNATYCSNVPAFTLTGGSPTGGSYTGTGVSAGTFNPATANPGSNIITYTYTAPNTCVNTCTFDYTVNTAPVALAGSYGPACYDGPDIVLNGTPAGGTWTGQGVTGVTFDPSFGTETLTYTYTSGNGCTDTDQTTIVVTSCAAPSTMRWALLEQNTNSGGGCVSNSDCNQNTICYGLEYTPLYTGTLTSYTTGFFMDCNNGTNPVISNMSCVMNDNSQTLNFCSVVDSILFNSSGNSGGLSITMGVPVIVHQVCFTIPSTGVMIITKDNTLGLSTSIDLAGGGFATDNVMFYTPYVVDSSIECAILPLTWLDFTAKADGEYTSLLDWATADEFNNSHFEIQRANDAGQAFRTIGRVEADDVTGDVHHYTFTDKAARPGKNYYRLKQVDHDGRYQYSPLRSVSFAASRFAIEVLPNPAQDMLTVYMREALTAGHITMVDMAGRIVYEGTFDAGTDAHEILLDRIQAGIYSLVVTSGEDRNVQKVVIIE